MKKARVQALAALFIVIFAAWWGVSVLIGQRQPVAAAPAQDIAAYSGSSPLVLRRSVDGHTTTYSGTLTLPSTCDSLGTGIKTRADSPMRFMIELSIIQPSGLCASASSGADSQPFSVSVTSKSGAPAPEVDGITVDGTLVPTMITTAP